MPFYSTRRVEFRDTDAAGIVHFSAFFPMMEAAEHELLRSLEIPILCQPDDQAVTWPRVSATCNYRSAARFEDVLRIEVTVRKIGNSSVEYGFRFFRDSQGVDAANQPPVEVANGSITAVACRFTAPGHLHKVAIPDSVRERLSRYLDAPAEL